MLKHICYLNDNYIDIKTTTLNHFISDSIANGEIINRDKFISDFKHNIKKQSILTKTIKVLLNKEIKESDILYYTSIFEELNYNKTILVSTNHYLENDTLIPNSNYYILYHNKEYINITKEYLSEILNIFHISKLRIISNKLLSNNKLCKYFYYNNSEKFFFS